MVSASYPLCLLIFITISSFFFFNYQLMGAAWVVDESSGSFLHSREEQVQKLSGEDGHGSEIGSQILFKFRILLGMQATTTMKTPKHGGHEYSPAPAPVGEVVTPAPARTLLKAHLSSRSPVHHRHPIAPVQSLEYGSGNAANRRRRRTVAAVAGLAGSIFLLLAFAIILKCKKSRRNHKRRSGKLMPLSTRRSKFQVSSNPSSKVSFDPGPELFYLNSLAPYLESGLSLKQASPAKSAFSNGSMPYLDSDFSLDHASQSQNIFSNESMPNFVSHTGEPLKCESDTLSSSGKENLPVENLPSDDESFHSACCSHSINRSFSDASEENFSQHSANCSPFSSSHGSISPSHKLPKFSTGSSLDLATENISKHYIPCSSSHNFNVEGITSKTPSSPKHQDRGSCQSLIRHSACDTELANQRRAKNDANMDSVSVKTSSSGKQKCPPTRDETSSATLKPKLVSTAKDASKEPSFSLRQIRLIPSDNTSKPAQPSSLPASGQIPKPPPPPLPPINSPLFPNGSYPGKPPPPPPCPPRQTTPVGKDGTPLPKLKPLHWDKVRATPDRSMVWDKIRSSSFEFDEKMIESLFGYKSQSSAKPEEVRNKSPSPSKNVMEHKRLQNITILMKALNVTSEQVCEALKLGRGLCIQQLEALVKMAPTKEEEEKLSNYQGNIDELDPAEKFLKVVINKPFAFARSEVMLYRETFEDEVAHLRSSFEMLEEACKELRSSRLFLRLLEAVLKTGNRMNVGTIRGGARAFKLDALLKLADVKGTDGKTTLLHFVVQEMIRSEGTRALETAKQKSKEKLRPRSVEEREEDYRAAGLNLVSGLGNELCNVKKTASIDLDVLVSSVSNLSCGMAQLKHLSEELSTDSRNESFVQSMTSFTTDAEKIIKELKDEEEKVLIHVREITEYYHGDVSKEEANPLRIFVIVRDFLGMLDRACKEVKSSKAHQCPFPVVPFR